MEAPNKAIIEKLKKIRALALEGTDGERDVAEQIFDKLCKKYNVALSDIKQEDPVKRYNFSYNNDYAEFILQQVIKKVTHSDDMYSAYNGEQKMKIIATDCTYEQKVIIDLLYDFYITLLEKELAVVVFAFCVQHNIMRTLTEEEKERALNEPSAFTEEEKKKISMAMLALSADEPTLSKFLMGHEEAP